MSGTSIEWTDCTWNPVRGCTRVSAGCRNCYAERIATRFSHKGAPYEGFADVSRRHSQTGRATTGVRGHWTGRVELIHSKLDEPLRWRKPRRVFVNSMSDLFHEALPEQDIVRVFSIMQRARRHTFQVLTKRPARMADVVRRIMAPEPPLQNVWLGVSCEDQATADERIPLLLQTPAAKRFVSLEPLLGPIDVGLSSATCSCCPRWSSRWVRLHERVFPDALLGFVRPGWASPGIYRAESNPHGALSVRDSAGELLGIKPAEFEPLPGLDWVILGGESGPGARPMRREWARSVRDQCREAGVAFFYKQEGSRLRCNHNAKGGHIECFPENLRVREFPS